MDKIVIRPATRYWIMHNFSLCFWLALVVVAFAVFGSDSLLAKVSTLHPDLTAAKLQRIRPFVSVVGLVILIYGVLKGMYSFIAIKCLRWEIFPDHIEMYKGIIARKRDHLELYRVTDYQEDQGVIERLIMIKRVNLTTSDSNNKMVTILGVDSNIDLTSIIRERVEYVKGHKRVIELANSGFE